ncbi:MAG: bifunctional phosphopantothenoylcysteine decarboxylase/phosphopantothenate--cysteine ligase CoaBC [Thermodesulfobacteriota bacterium]
MTGRLQDKQLILGVCGGIAAYKSVELLRLMTKQGARVRVVMTRHAGEFVAPLTFEALSGEPVCIDLFDRTDRDASIRHIDWAQEADAAVIAPATANLVAKLANGTADDALSTFLLAMICPVLVCPSMNTHMYQHPSVQRNLDRLKTDGHRVLEPGAGQLACGTVGPGRLPEPEQILDRLIARLTPKDLAGKRVLVTAGPTREFIDPVRFISNPSSGKMGFAVAAAAEHRGAEVTLVTGPTRLSDPADIRTIRVVSAREMAEAVFDHFEAADIIIKTAAVSDYSPRETADHKIKKGAEEMDLVLQKNIDILRTLGGRKRPNQFLAGFAAETQDLRENACKKMVEKNLDLIVGNLVGNPDSGFSADTNRVTLFFPNREKEPLEIMDKASVAHRILDRIVERLS